MKTLVISRPDGLGQFGRSWPFLHEYEGFTRAQMMRAHAAIYKNQPESFTKDSALVQLEYMIHGCQMVVEKQLSRDLEVSKVSGDIASLVWPSETLWLIFQDIAIPHALLSKRLCVSASGARSVGFCLCLPNKDGAMNGVMIGQHDWNAYINGAQYPHYPAGFGDEKMPSNEEESVQYMAALCSKVLAYASIPRHAEPCLVTRDQKKKAGIHPRIQTQAPAVLVRYLPRIIHDSEHGSSGDTHAFYGRAGHIRMYKDERYTNMLGKWQWIPPIPPPDGVKVEYRVRKVKEAA